MPIKRRILIVDSEDSIVDFLRSILTVNSYEVITASDGIGAYSMITTHCPDVVLLEIDLPDMDGISIIKSVRQWTNLPIIVLSARTHEREKVTALDCGADDYITKPFGVSELLARIRTAIRHSQNSEEISEVVQSGVFKASGLTVDFNKRKVFVNHEDARLTQNEYKIIALLCQHAGKVLTYDYIIKKLWGPTMCGDNQILRVNMANIRRKIEENPAQPKYIFTENGVGYRMIESD